MLESVRWGGRLSSVAPGRPRSNIWSRTRLKLVALVGAIVAATIISVIVAVVSSAHHADALAITQERARLSLTIAHLRDQLLHELASLATTPRAIRGTRDRFDQDWVDR